MTRRADRWWKGLSEEMLTRAIKTQLVLLTVLAVIAVVVLGWYFLRIPSLVGIDNGYQIPTDASANVHSSVGGRRAVR